uniref:Ovule protein n=1 Tax=Mesocestoides corti TaxID=53468 RepID=A0A5K3FXL2_MESCO
MIPSYNFNQKLECEHASSLMCQHGISSNRPPIISGSLTSSFFRQSMFGIMLLCDSNIL